MPFSKNKENSTLGPLEFKIMECVRTLKPNAYGITIKNCLLEFHDRSVTIGAIYTVLARLEQKKFVSSEWGEKSDVRGGRRKKLYKLTPAGSYAMISTEQFFVHTKKGGMLPMEC